jgi:hypothetical protein
MKCGAVTSKSGLHVQVAMTLKFHLEKHSVFQGVPGSSFHGGVGRHFYST